MKEEEERKKREELSEGVIENVRFQLILKSRNLLFYLSIKLSQDRTFSVVLSQGSSLLEEEIERRFAEGWGN